jgi:hypothetical protein
VCVQTLGSGAASFLRVRDRQYNGNAVGKGGGKDQIQTSKNQWCVRVCENSS